MLRSSTVQHFSCCPGPPSSPRRTGPASPATEAAESVSDPGPTTVSPALLTTPSLQVSLDQTQMLRLFSHRFLPSLLPTRPTQGDFFAFVLVVHGSSWLDHHESPRIVIVPSHLLLLNSISDQGAWFPFLHWLPLLLCNLFRTR